MAKRAFTPNLAGAKAVFSDGVRDPVCKRTLLKLCVGGCLVAVIMARALAVEVGVRVGDSQENLFVSEGDPTAVAAVEERGSLFKAYYYELENITYLVNLETGYICDISEGRMTGSCFPCEGLEVSESCP